MKRRIRLKGHELRNVISEAVRRILNESEEYPVVEITKKYDFENGPEDFPILFEVTVMPDEDELKVISFEAVNNEVESYPHMTEEQLQEVMSAFENDDFSDDVYDAYASQYDDEDDFPGDMDAKDYYDRRDDDFGYDDDLDYDDEL